MTTIREEILTESKIIAVVGLSPNPERVSYTVAQTLQSGGYKIVPVNPAAGVDEIMGEKVYPDLESIPFKVDMIDVFRRTEFVPALVDSAIKVGVKYIWMQDGVEDLEAEKKAEAAGIKVVMDDCANRVYRRFVIEDRIKPPNPDAPKITSRY